MIFKGSGTSKKLAKRNAAAKMLSRIHDVPVDMRSSHEVEAEDDTFNMVWNACAALLAEIFDYLDITSNLICLPNLCSLSVSV